MPYEHITPQMSEARQEVQECKAWLKKAKDTFERNKESLARMEKKYRDLKLQYPEKIPSDIQQEFLQLEVDIQSKKDIFEKFKPERVIQQVEGKLAEKERHLRSLVAQATLDSIDKPHSPIKMNV